MVTGIYYTQIHCHVKLKCRFEDDDGNYHTNSTVSKVFYCDALMGIIILCSIHIFCFLHLDYISLRQMILTFWSKLYQYLKQIDPAQMFTTIQTKADSK